MPIAFPPSSTAPEPIGTSKKEQTMPRPNNTDPAISKNFQIPIPTGWTDQQADAVFEFANKIAEVVFLAYQEELVDLAERELDRPEHDPRDLEEELPF